MEEKYGVKGNIFKGIFFTEQSIKPSKVIKTLEVEISRQNSDLTEVKEKMAQEAKVLGADAICEFQYGQKKHSALKLLAFKWDTESWFGKGIAVKIR